ncbi:MAG: hypothetical protein E7353_02245 [Clostridiales bacterium]|nr:hypothetical protein [Clostridiales bacterium]
MQSDFCQLQKGTTLNCAGGIITVKEFIGRGGQGEVYRVSLGGKDYALKYYHPKNCKAQFKESLSALIELLKNNPVNSRSYVWPLYLVEHNNQFGYVMELIPEKYCFVSDFLNGEGKPSNEILLKVCANLSEAFRQLHASGYSYKDISYGNVAFDTDNGDVVIFDNDNVTPNGGKSFVTGTHKFLAPELVFDEKNNAPNRYTDLHSLAVLMFMILFFEHPLEGARVFEIPEYKPDHDLQMYGPDNAQFIFADKYNLDRYIYCNNVPEPDKQYYCTDYKNHIDEVKSRWKACPDSIRDLFIKTFVGGIKEPRNRVPDSIWKEAFSPARWNNNVNRHEEKTIIHEGNTPVIKVYANEGGRRKEVQRVAISSKTDMLLRYFPYFSGNFPSVLFTVTYEGGKVKIENVSGVELYRGGSIGKNQSIVFSQNGEFYIYDNDDKQYRCKIRF